MPVNQDYSFLYKIQALGLSSERINDTGVLIFRILKDWKLVDKLNRIKEFTVVVLKRDIDVSEIYFEREVFIPAYEFRGIITQIIDNNDDNLTIVVKEHSWHLTRRLYKIGDEMKEYQIQLAEGEEFLPVVQDVLDSANMEDGFNWIINTGRRTEI